MKKEIQTFEVLNDAQLPSLATLQRIPFCTKYVYVFGSEFRDSYHQIGAHWQAELSEFLVNIHLQRPEIHIQPLRAFEALALHQDFFVQCASDYRALAAKLVFEFVAHFDLVLDTQNPLRTFNPLKQNRSAGTIGDWTYSIHGFHCWFVHVETGQQIEAPLAWGMEFGELDPYFFVQFIQSTVAYQPLPLQFCDEFQDGSQILKAMLQLGRFEKFQSFAGPNSGIAVADRAPIVAPFWVKQGSKAD